MRALAASLFVISGLLLGCDAQPVAPKVIPLWPEPVSGPAEVVENNRIVKVNQPSITVYTPAKANGTALVICPGGGYHHLTIGENGGPETQFFTRLGVTVFVLKYRVQALHPAPLNDVLRALRVVRSQAADFGVRPDRIGIFGASAGGHLAACAATMWDEDFGKTGSTIDGVNARPDFAILIYPVISMQAGVTHRGSRENLLGKTPSPALVDQLSVEKRVRRDMPPVFLVATMADTSVPVENSLQFYQALRDAKVPAEMHVYAQGSHGNSLDSQYGPTARWPLRAEEWMHFNGWLPVND